MSFIDKRNIKIIALALSLPSSLFCLAWLLLKLAEQNIISKLTAVIVLLLYLFNTIFLIAYYVSRNKN